MATPTFILPSAPTYTEGFVNGLNVYPNPTNFVANQVPFTRATTATRTNAAGLIELVPYNLFTYSEQFNDAAWGKLGGSSVIANQAIAPNGTMTADLITEGTSVLVYNTALYPAGTYTQSYYAKKGTGDIFGMYFGGSYGARFNLTTGTVVSVTNATASITNVGDGWYRCIATATPVSDFFGGISYSNTTGATIFAWGAQIVAGTSVLPYLETVTRLNRPRVDFSLGGCPNLLLEPQRTNLMLRSEDFANATWIKSRAIVTANSVASPSGILNASTITETTFTNNFSGAEQLVNVVNGTTYTQSIFVKRGNIDFFSWGYFIVGGANGGVIYNLTTKQITYSINIVSSSITDYADGWVRISVTYTANASGANYMSALHTKNPTSINYNGNGTGFTYIWGAQLESGAYPTTYIPTSSASVTRNQDTFQLSNVFTNNLISSAGGTWFVELRNNIPLTRDGGGSELYLGEDGSSFSAAGKQSFTIRNNGVSAVTMSFSYWNGSGISDSYIITPLNPKIAIKFTATTYDLFVNGVKVLSARPISWTLSNVQFLNALAGTTRFINSMALYNTPLTDDELEVITGEGFDTYALMASNYNYILQ